jgi:hypothetical protein
MKHVMHDLETLSLKPNAVIVSLGAVIFTADGTLDTFYQPISLYQPDRHIDHSTITWWMGQPLEAREVFFAKDRGTLGTVLSMYAEFLYMHGVDGGVWANGADFDNVVLTDAYQYCDMTTPWHYTKSRCFRTIRALYPEIQSMFVGTQHNALADAMHQAKHLLKIYKDMGKPFPL